jgi:hypothetical protein
MVRITDHDLFCSKTENLERLARAIGAEIPKKIAREGEYRRKLVLSIARQEHRIERLDRQAPKKAAERVPSPT